MLVVVLGGGGVEGTAGYTVCAPRSSRLTVVQQIE